MNQRFFLCICLGLITSSVFSQLEIQQQSSKKKGWKQEKTNTQVSFEFNRNTCFRTLIPNPDFLNKPLGERANEVSSNAWSYLLGLQTGLGRWLRFESGVQLLQNGEEYTYASTETDSTFHYTNRYRYMGLPLSLNLQYGAKFKVFLGPGINPLLFNRYVQEKEWTTALGSTSSARFKEKNNQYTSAVLQAYLQAGMQYTGTNGWGLIAKATYRQQLTNTYGKYSEVIHKPYAWGWSIGLVKKL